MERAMVTTPSGPTALLSRLPWLAAALSLAAAGIHFAVAPEHFDEYWLFGWFFIVVAWLQAIWALALVGFASRRLVLIGGISLNVAVVGLWLWTRTIGVPVGPDSGATEAFGWADIAASGLEVGTAVVAAALLLEKPEISHDGWAVLWLVLGSVVLAALVGLVLAAPAGKDHHDDTTTETHDHVADD